METRIKPEPSASNPPDGSWVDKAELSSINQEIREPQQIENREVLVVFNLGNETYAVPIERVREVVRVPNIAPIPQAPEYILGVGNIRGNVIAIADLAKKLNPDNTETTYNEESYVVVLKDDTVQAGMIVNSVPDTIVVRSSQINTSTSVIKNLSANDQFIKGIVKVEDKMVILIDILDMMQT
ncbi:MAG: chemotaxis protein CheW [Marinoscillum sp.]